jgi:hypothetical protein
MRLAVSWHAMAFDPPETDDRRTLRPTQWDELGYLHNHRPGGRHSACSGCEQRDQDALIRTASPGHEDTEQVF